MGASCAREWESDDMVRYANTAQVVEDMVEIIERHGKAWRVEGGGEATPITEDMQQVSGR